MFCEIATLSPHISTHRTRNRFANLKLLTLSVIYQPNLVTWFRVWSLNRIETRTEQCIITIIHCTEGWAYATLPGYNISRTRVAHAFSRVRCDFHKPLNRFAMALASGVTGQSDLHFGKYTDSCFVIACKLEVFSEPQSCIAPWDGVGVSNFKNHCDRHIQPHRVEGVHDCSRVFLLGLHMLEVAPSPEALHQVPLLTCSNNQ
jgi:hypothetical protein